MKHLWLVVLFIAVFWLGSADDLLFAKPETGTDAVQDDLLRSLTGDCLIKGGKLVTLTAEGTFEGDLLIRGGKIVALGRNLDSEESIPIIEAQGRTVIPGLIDACSRYMLTSSHQAKANGTGNVLDLFDYFDDKEMAWALARGVTTLVLTPHSREGFCGKVAVVKLIPDAPLESMIVKKDAALYIGLGVKELGRTVSRLRSAYSLAKKFESARDYRDSWDDYHEELKAYLDALESEKSASEETTQEPPPDDAPDGSGSAPKRSGKDKKRSGKNNKNEQGKDKKDIERDGQEEDEGPKKPKRPGFNMQNELLVQAMNGRIAVHCEVHRAADIVQVLDWKRRFQVDLVLLGCTEGVRVLDAIEQAEVPVILDSVNARKPFEPDVRFFQCPDTAVRMAEHSIPLALASSPGPRTTRFLRINAASAAGAGLDPDKAIEAVTAAPARILGIEDRVGSLEAGKDGDIVILDGDPLDSDARVILVMINGRTVYAGQP